MSEVNLYIKMLVGVIYYAHDIVHVAKQIKLATI